MSYAYQCEICDREPTWTITRVGDVVTSWACPQDLSLVCAGLQRHWELTELRVKSYAKSAEWAEINRTLNRIAEEKP